MWTVIFSFKINGVDIFRVIMVLTKKSLTVFSVIVRCIRSAQGAEVIIKYFQMV